MRPAQLPEQLDVVVTIKFRFDSPGRAIDCYYEAGKQYSAAEKYPPVSGIEPGALVIEAAPNGPRS
jgi:hypothetical protein